jgi:hypothetical protein
MSLFVYSYVSKNQEFQILCLIEHHGPSRMKVLRIRVVVVSTSEWLPCDA